MLYFPSLFMDKISKLIPKVLAARGLKSQADASYAVYLAVDWLHTQSVGLAEQCIVTTLKDQTLTVECLHSIALQEMQQKSEDLKAYLNSFEGIVVRAISIIRSKTY